MMNLQPQSYKTWTKEDFFRHINKMHKIKNKERQLVFQTGQEGMNQFNRAIANTIWEQEAETFWSGDLLQKIRSILRFGDSDKVALIKTIIKLR